MSVLIQSNAGSYIIVVQTKSTEDFKTLFLKHIPLERMRLFEEFAAAVVYFASGNSAYTIGRILAVSDDFGLATSVYGELKDKINKR